ncbi:glycerate kinase type-2 family protein [Allorhodopirellula heiligendammensis]|uniref:Hydroxypyruvate reductase n=1 Tax=Allorhodopirellula heiligendammensis TaxID=2714739 RepID=A0A5C6C5G1_9BACT|nr:DUF4147 domain-containing protein [Allorhodopirellula heiligendammensis]TWU19345.1 putative hydroxypyruvate reductase [Allorhodopirellula heiligendammensis]
MRDLRRDGTQIFEAGVDAVRGDQLIRDCVRLDDQHLWLGTTGIPRDAFDRLIVVGAGKASGAMAVGLVQALSQPAGGAEVGDSTSCSSVDARTRKFRSMSSPSHSSPSPRVAHPCRGEGGDRRFEIIGQVNVPAGGESVPEGLDWPADLRLFPARPASINEPTTAAIAGTDRILELANAAGDRDLVIALISGGGSALLCRPVAGVTLDEKLAVIRHLSSHGASITELNTVRKHLSEVKGGGLARAAAAATLVTLVLSDVLGDPLDLIASGPTVPDRSSADDALQLLAKFDPNRQLPAAVYQAITARQAASRSELVVDRAAVRITARGADRGMESPIIVLGNNAVAVDAAGVMASSIGYVPDTRSARCGEGLAETVGEELAERVLTMLRNHDVSDAPRAVVTGGEPVVRLADDAIRGRGGRNQQLVLAAYRWLLGAGLTNDQWQRLLILSGGTDGEDGPTDAAGAFIDGAVHDHALELGLAPDEFLRCNNAYAFFEQTGGLLITGPTGTNVCDLRVALVMRSTER